MRSLYPESQVPDEMKCVLQLEDLMNDWALKQ